MISLVLPAYNESRSLPGTIADIRAALAGLSEFAEDFEIIVVDDHSEDDTFGVVAALADPRITCLRLSKRSGSHVALRVGLARARGRVACCLSADGQDDPGALPRMIAAWRDGARVVWALRRNLEEEPLRVRLFAQVFYRLLQMLNPGLRGRIDLSRADFYLLDRRVVDAIVKCGERNTSLFGLIVWLGFTQTGVEYDRRPRRHGQSKWNFRSKMRLALDWIVSFSGVPLRLMTFLGFGIAGLGALYALVVIVRAIFFGAAVLGWPSIVTLILILGGLQLVTLGVFGEYLWRIFDETKKRPLAFIEADSGRDADQGPPG
ncbi:MAG: glycosyltransferase family 2 protein [Desulfovibrio sp.]|nr:glycosyltransferase family 2 protein [Desulfovibrio sp.]